MASRTQIRLAQLTGSFDVSNGINDQITRVATGSANLTDLEGVLSHMAGAIKRIHGSASFSENELGTFYQNLTIQDHDTTSPSARSLTIGDDVGGVDNFVVFGNDNVKTALGVDDDATAFAINVSDNNGAFDGSQANDFEIDGSGNATFGASATITTNLTVNNDLSVAGDATVTGNLTVTGDIDYKYVTSSIVEFNDPMLVTNAIDQSSNAGLQITSASFAHATGEIEGQSNNENSFDYGVVWKRSLGYGNGVGSYVDASPSAPNLFPGLVSAESSDNRYNEETDGYPFGVFDASNASATIENDKEINITLNNINRSNVRASDLLNAMKGAYVVVSGSTTKKKLGIITGQNANAVTVRILGSSDKYGDITQTTADDNINAADVTAVHLLNAYAGSIFDKRTSTFHMAAGAITGSGDNNFISGSANILQYGAVSLGKLSLFSNDVVSGSSEVLNAEYRNVEGRALLQTSNNNVLEIKGDNGTDNSVALILSSSGDLKLVANDNHLILPGDFSFNPNDQLIVNSDGEIQAQAAAAAADSNEGKAVFTVKPGVTITAGFGGAGTPANPGLCLTASATSGVGSQHFAMVDSNHDADILDKINLLTDENMFRKLEVYVNGQLLTSGASNATGVTTGDYAIVSRSANFLSGAFAFDLEADDIITLIRKL